LGASSRPAAEAEISLLLLPLEREGQPSQLRIAAAAAVFCAAAAAMSRQQRRQESTAWAAAAAISMLEAVPWPWSALRVSRLEVSLQSRLSPHHQGLLVCPRAVADPPVLRRETYPETCRPVAVAGVL